MFPFDQLMIIVNWLRGNGPAPSRNKLIHALTAILNYIADTLFPEKPSTEALPPWLTGPLASEILKFLLSLVTRFLIPSTAAVTAEGDALMADKLEEWAKQAQAK